MDSASTLRYMCYVVDIDYYRERPEDKDKPERERRWELVNLAYAVVDVRAKLTLFVGTHTEAAQQVRIYEQTSEDQMEELREKIRKHLAEIGHPKITCTETSSEAGDSPRWRGLRREK